MGAMRPVAKSTIFWVFFPAHGEKAYHGDMP